MKVKKWIEVPCDTVEIFFVNSSLLHQVDKQFFNSAQIGERIVTK